MHLQWPIFGTDFHRCPCTLSPSSFPCVLDSRGLPVSSVHSLGPALGQIAVALHLEIDWPVRGWSLRQDSQGSTSMLSCERRHNLTCIGNGCRNCTTASISPRRQLVMGDSACLVSVWKAVGCESVGQLNAFLPLHFCCVNENKVANLVVERLIGTVFNVHVGQQNGISLGLVWSLCQQTTSNRVCPQDNEPIWLLWLLKVLAPKFLRCPVRRYHSVKHPFQN